LSNPRAKGAARNMSGFKPVLTNEYNKSFILDPKVFIVWSLCNGKNTLDEIKSKFNNKLGVGCGERDELNVQDVITSLERIGLVEN